MQEYIINGLINAEPVKGDLESGMIVVIKEQGQFYRVVLEHLNTKGEWVVSGDVEGAFDPEYIYRLYVLASEGCFLINFKDYKKIFKNNWVGDGEFKPFMIKPYKFKEGKSGQVCSSCDSHFVAAPSQPYCKNCCETRYALAHLGQDIKVKTVKPVEQDSIINLAMAAFDKGREKMSEKDFHEWLAEEMKRYE